MRQVAILGIGQTVIDEHWDKSLREIAGEAAFAALADAGPPKNRRVIRRQTCFPRLWTGRTSLAHSSPDWVGCGPGSRQDRSGLRLGRAAFRAGLMAVASGELESVLVVGVEKMTDKAGHDVTAALATAADADYEVDQGISFVGINALVMRRYMHEFGWKHIDFAPFSINAHANAMHNPYARLHDTITAEQFEKSAMVATPINLLDASRLGWRRSGGDSSRLRESSRCPARANRGRRFGLRHRYDSGSQPEGSAVPLGGASFIETGL